MAKRLTLVAFATFVADLVQGFYLAPTMRPTASASRVASCRDSLRMTAVTQKSARAEGLALLLDDGTRKSHSLAENTAFVNGFFKGAPPSARAPHPQ